MYGRKKLGLLILTLIMVVGCEKSSTTLVAVPNVQLDCQLAACNGSISATTALVLLSKSGCENDYEIPAAATPGLSCDGSGCGGAATNWIDGQSQVVGEIFTGSYDLCVLIDVDNSGNTSYTSGDIVYEDSVIVDSSSTILASGGGWRVVN